MARNGLAKKQRYIKDFPPTEEHWVVFRRNAICICKKKRQLTLIDIEDCTSFCLSHFDWIWKQWNPNMVPWLQFSNFCLGRMIHDWMRKEFGARWGLPASRVWEYKNRIRSIDLEYKSKESDIRADVQFSEAFIDRRCREPVDFLITSELLKTLIDTLTNLQMSELVRWYQGHKALTKQQCNLRERIREKAENLLPYDELLDWTQANTNQKKRNKEMRKHLKQRMASNKIRRSKGQEIERGRINQPYTISLIAERMPEWDEPKDKTNG